LPLAVFSRAAIRFIETRGLPAGITMREARLAQDRRQPARGAAG